MRKNGARALTSNSLAQSSRSPSRNEARSVTAATLASASMRPKRARHSAISLGGVAGSPSSAATKAVATPPSDSCSCHRVAASLVAAGQQQARGAGTRQGFRNGTADPLRRAGDQRHLAVNPRLHAASPEFCFYFFQYGTRVPGKSIWMVVFASRAVGCLRPPQPPEGAAGWPWLPNAAAESCQRGRTCRIAIAGDRIRHCCQVFDFIGRVCTGVIALPTISGR